MNVECLMSQIQAYNPDADFNLLRRSYEYSEACHSGQLRKSKEPYFIHCFEVAQTLIELKLDIDTICAGLLHDVLEDTGVTRNELASQFGETIAQLVEGVTKIGKYRFKGAQQRQAETYLKLLLATAKDIRVILIKLADRLHNMQTLSYLSREKQLRTAKQTLEVYAPLAHRLGIAKMKRWLEDLSFKYLYPTEYKRVAHLLSEKLTEREAYMNRMVRVIQKELDHYGLKTRVTGRTKHIYSIYQKIHQKGTPFEDIYDLIGLRVLVDTTADCYAALGVLHDKWYHIPERFKDFIGLRKANGYRSLHTTILDRERRVEVQIRTYEMHQVAEYGIAAHWSYKEGVPRKMDSRPFNWLRQMLEDIQELKDPYQFIREMKGELFQDEVYVFTPKGDLHDLPAGSTPIDFAYKIHTDIGRTCCGAEVNGTMVPLKYRLQNGDRVKILTAPNAHPGRDWLRWVKTARARGKIRHWLREQDRAQAMELGKRLLEIEMRRYHLNLRDYLKSPELHTVLEKLTLKTSDDLFMQIGNGKQSATHIVNLLRPESRTTTEKKDKPTEMPRSAPAIELEGIDLDGVRIMKCCNPIPGDEIIGYITRGRGVSIHKVDCVRMVNEPERIVQLDWKSVDEITYPAVIAVECDDRPGMLGEIATAIAQCKVNIVEGNFGITRPRIPRNGIASDQLTLAVTGAEQLESVMEVIRRLKGVRRVIRVT